MSDLDKRIERSQKAMAVIANPVAAHDEITTLRQQLEQAEARAAELSDELEGYRALKRLHRLENYPNEITARAWLLRKQAEAVERAAYRVNLDLAVEAYTEDEAFFFRQCRDAIAGEAQRLRQQADEAERGGI